MAILTEKFLPATSTNEIDTLFSHLFPICRSLTGEGVRASLAILQKEIPLKIHEIPSGTQVFDWEIPQEWNIKDAYIKDPSGNKVVDFQANNLHIVNYSIPFAGTLTLNELEPHLHSLPDQPTAIPYVTSYYKPYWGFCLSQQQRQKLKPNIPYEVKIDSTLSPGSLTYADLLIKGKSSQEILLSTYICHPSMANNELSGPILATYLAKTLMATDNLHYSYRFIFVPETIGAIAYLAAHKDTLKNNVVAGYVITCVGDPSPFSYLQSRTENTLTDRITTHVLKKCHDPFRLYSFLDRGSDERQYCSPGIDLPIGSLMRSKYGTYPEYHTSLDDLSFVTGEALYKSLETYLECIFAIENNHIYLSTNCCEPQLGKRGLYPNLGTKDSAKNCRLMLNLLAYADGNNDLLAIAEKLDCSIFELIPLATQLQTHGLLKITKATSL